MLSSRVYISDPLPPRLSYLADSFRLAPFSLHYASSLQIDHPDHSGFSSRMAIAPTASRTACPPAPTARTPFKYIYTAPAQLPDKGMTPRQTTIPRPEDTKAIAFRPHPLLHAISSGHPSLSFLRISILRIANRHPDNNSKPNWPTLPP